MMPSRPQRINDITTVAARSGNTEEDTKALFTFIKQIQNIEEIAPETLTKLNSKITSYKKNTDGTS